MGKFENNQSHLMKVLVVLLFAFLGTEPVLASVGSANTIFLALDEFASQMPVNISSHNFENISKFNPNQVAPKFSRLLQQTTEIGLRSIGEFLNTDEGKVLWDGRVKSGLVPLLSSIGAPQEIQTAVEHSPVQTMQLLIDYMNKPVTAPEPDTVSFLEVQYEFSATRILRLSVTSSWGIFVVLILLSSFWLFLLATHVYTDIFTEGMERLASGALQRNCDRDTVICTSSRFFLFLILVIFMLLFLGLTLFCLLRFLGAIAYVVYRNVKFLHRQSAVEKVRHPGLIPLPEGTLPKKSEVSVTGQGEAVPDAPVPVNPTMRTISNARAVVWAFMEVLLCLTAFVFCGLMFICTFIWLFATFGLIPVRFESATVTK